MYLKSVLRLLLVYFLAAELKTVQAERIEAPDDKEVELRTVQAEKILW